jgi:hypothetical protein
MVFESCVLRNGERRQKVDGHPGGQNLASDGRAEDLRKFCEKFLP